MIDIIWGRYSFLLYLTTVFIITLISGFFYIEIWLSSIFFGILTVLAWKDYFQKKHGVVANYPLLGRFRYLLESIRPELR
jgi:hypothetical protein